MTKQTEKSPSPAKVETVAAPKKKLRPSPEQLQQITQGGRYAFNPETGAMSPLRQHTKAAEPGAKTGAK
ncbi:hypothetical protein [Zhongshania aliphaticivorans]|uniref:hypothetical protein n=1 Tax=Zhongshania aliphaticivorans TaxID=1470434 RepID=UPI0012E44968|nr:hypothetical protein [Zhongshania aliphaticivorans]CAA0103582.1 Uncharacterised protein [Zhongshania aliphaticivorans]